ncbi:MAG: hypothetical protein IJM82_03465 [Synergistaceae bacterium]|nr:hypothetical protein [Synergistaceae bacterium]MBQ7068208.1 hypothetical protein [Synergistaceae bacterium]MBR0253359.1 hypothetical protein [Synergistaceae bacterium]
MTSSDNYVTIEIFNQGIQEIKNEISNIHSEISNLHSEIRDVKYENRLNSAKIDWLQHSIYWGFAVIAFVVAYVSLRPSRKEKSEKQKFTTAEQVQEIVDNAITRAFANLGKLS